MECRLSFNLNMNVNKSQLSPDRPNKRHASTLSDIVTVLLSLANVFMAWKGLCLLTNSPVPIVCVVSESMSPAFHRGDILFLWNRQGPAAVGDIPVVWFDGAPLPMVHRIIQTFEDSSGRYLAAELAFLLYLADQSISRLFLTKGDNNEVDDVSLYPGDRTLVSQNEVMGVVKGYVPFLGWLVIRFQESSWVKCFMYAVAVWMFFL